MATIKGKWLFDEYIAYTSYITFVENVTFTSNGKTFNSINSTYYESSGKYYIDYDETEVFDGKVESWTNEAYRTVDFGETEQTISDTFYNWLTANATQQTEEELPTEYATITYNGETFTLTAGQTATFPCTGKKMQSNITAEVVGEAADELAGTWVLNDTLTDVYPFTNKWTYTLNFTSNNNEYTRFANNPGGIPGKNNQLHYGSLMVYQDGTWLYGDAYKTINIASNLAEVTNGGTLLTWLRANATKQGEVALISFTIDGTSYQSPDGWTWYEWANSDYNTSYFKCNSQTGSVFNGHTYVTTDGLYDSKVIGSNVIIPNYNYLAYSTGGGAN